MRLNQVTVGCTDYEASCAFYAALGLRRIVDAPPRYARFETPAGETVSIHLVDRAASTTVVYFEVDDVDATVAALAAGGIAVASPPADQPWLWREARLIDPAGNPVCVYRAGDARRFPPWRVDGRSPVAAVRRYVVTGGPGSGKTSLIERLAGYGLASMPEAGRTIIRDQLAIGGDALPWGDRAAFATAMLIWDLRSHREAGRCAGPVLFDRGIPDIVGYLRLCGLPVPDVLLGAARRMRYAEPIFIAPHWSAIYAMDAERRQDAREAEATCHAVAAAYAEFGYRLVELPEATVEQRARFVLDRIGG